MFTCLAHTGPVGALPLKHENSANEVVIVYRQQSRDCVSIKTPTPRYLQARAKHSAVNTLSQGISHSITQTIAGHDSLPRGSVTIYINRTSSL